MYYCVDKTFNLQLEGKSLKYEHKGSELSINLLHTIAACYMIFKISPFSQFRQTNLKSLNIAKFAKEIDQEQIRQSIKMYNEFILDEYYVQEKPRVT